MSEVPYFVGQDPLSVLLEPLYASAGSFPLSLGNQIWGDAVMFERGDIDEAAFLDDLRRTVRDDGLLMEYLQVTTVGRTRIVPIGETIRESIERPVRWTQILRWHFPGAIVGTWLISLLVLAGAVLAPLSAAAVLTVGHLAVNEILGVEQFAISGREVYSQGNKDELSNGTFTDVGAVLDMSATRRAWNVILGVQEIGAAYSSH
ncbi:hypothetical protein [Natrinema sp. 74]|uniref:hypothetical protein n=1 Tax=Natrinema sp. 74 TaxID=3384159 RepID=UPI0038D44062